MRQIKWVTQYIILFIILFGCTKDSTNQTSLNGTWNFLASSDISEQEVLKADYSSWDTLQVPGNWDTRQRYSKYVGKAYYQRTIKIPGSWEGRQVRIKFDAVYQTAKVWLNGQLLGNHVGGYTPFEFNITDKVEAGKSYSMLVQADNTFKRGAWWAWGGISRNVSLISNNTVRIVYQQIEAVPDFDKEMVNFVIRYKIENNSSKQQEVNVEYEIRETGINGKLTGSIHPSETRIIENSFAKPLADFELWHFNNPNLYELLSTINVGGEVVDSCTDKFGIRKIEVRGEQLFLNNEAIRVNGLNRVHDHPVCGNTEPDWLVKQDMLDIKSLGCNMSRLMHAPSAENLLDFCDSIGYMIIGEIPVWGNDDPNSFPDNPLTKQWLKEMIERDFNHPCIIAWSVGNELRDSVPPWGKKLLTSNQLGYINSMLDYLDELDTTRLKTYVSLTAHSQGANKENEPFDKLDFICLNNYGNAVKAVESAHNNLPGKPIFLSEIGKGQIGPAPDALLQEELVEYMNELKNFSYLVGFAYWCYNDYRSNYKGTPESGFREWGIVDELRNKKAAYEQLKDIFSKW